MSDAAAIESFLAPCAWGMAAHERVLAAVAPLAPIEARVTRSQLAYRRRRSFAWLWLPGRWLARPAADLVLSIALGRADGSPRWKQVAHPTPRWWMHHLELQGPDDIDAQAGAWLREAAALAS